MTLNKATQIPSGSKAGTTHEPRLDIALLGEFLLRKESEPISLNIASHQALLAYVVIHDGQHHSRQHLAFKFWPDSTESQALTNLRKALHVLRQEIPDADTYLEITRRTVHWRTDAPCSVDVWDFESAVSQAQQTTTPHEQQSYLEQAVAAYHGDFLPGFYDDWILARRETYRATYLGALDKLLRLYENRRRFAEAVQLGKKLLGEDPLNETVCRRLMLLLARSGQFSAALRQFRICQSLLEKELGVEPSRETISLYEKIKQAATARRHNLSPDITPFIGRKSEIGSLLGFLSDPNKRLITIVGLGGMGKSRLAVAVARQLERENVKFFLHGVRHVSLAGIDTVSGDDDLALFISKELGLVLTGSGSVSNQLVSYLQKREMLLILDNYEHLLPQMGLIVRILRETDEVKCLVTSRARLGLHCETTFELGGMSHPPVDQSLRKVDLHQFDALHLFEVSGQRARSSFSLAHDPASSVKICHLVGQMPLALELAAAWLRTMTAEEIAAEIQKGFELLVTLAPDIPDRHKSWRAVFDRSWSKLSDDERWLMKQIAIFRGGFSFNAIQDVALLSEPVRPVLDGLVEKSFLQLSAENRYKVHELLRQYTQESLEKDQAATANVRARHLAYFSSFLARREIYLKGGRQAQALAELKSDSENIRVAWDYAILTKDLTNINRAAEGLAQFYEWDGRFIAGENAFRRAAELFDNQGDPISVPPGDQALSLAKILAWQAAFAHSLGNLSRALDLLNQSKSLLSKANQPSIELNQVHAFVLQKIGRIKNSHGEREEAWQMFQESLELYSANDDQWGKANLLIMQGEWLWGTGMYADARFCLENSLKISRKTNNLREVATSLWWLSLIATYLGQADEAEQLVTESLAIYEELGYSFGVADGLLNLGTARCFNGKFVDAKQNLERSKLLFAEIGAEMGLLAEQMHEAVQMHLGNYKEVNLQVSISYYQGEGVERGLALGLLMFGGTELAQGRYDHAQKILQESIDRYRNIDQKDELGLALSFMGIAAINLDNPSQAVAYFQEALQIGIDIKGFLPVIHALPGVALLLAYLGKYEQALELFALMQTLPYVSESRWFDDVIGNPIELAARSLTKEKIEAARARGRTYVIEGAVAAWYTWLPDLLKHKGDGKRPFAAITSNPP